MKKIGIIGGGFTGIMTAIQLIKKMDEPCTISIINDKDHFTRGIAYNPYSSKQLLNVTAGKMSAFPDEPDHFMEWLMAKESFRGQDRSLIANSFMPRKIYGEYLTYVWNSYLPVAEAKGITLNIHKTEVSDLVAEGKVTHLSLKNGENLTVDYCVIATGNHVPRNPRISNPEYYNSKTYYRNPWLEDSVTNVDEGPVLIIGNGLTMVDTVIGLLEKNYKGEIYSLSPNGFNILPHRHSNIAYTALKEDLKDTHTLQELVTIVNNHIKKVREFGVSAEPVIDALRPYTQKLWRGFSDLEKKHFMARLRHLWGVARHRIPLHIYDKIQQLRLDGRLHIKSGKILNFTEKEGSVYVDYFDKKEKLVKTFAVTRIINCTGPETDIMLMENCFLKNCLLNGLIKQDSLKLGITADPDHYNVIDAEGNKVHNIFVIGSGLRGELWESTAVNELRQQAEKLAENIKNLQHENTMVANADIQVI